jgi:DNA-directed RNA polymerase specialized sigma24 family protein
MSSQAFDTPVSLLERLRENEAGAWEEFSVRYVRVLKRWCASWGIQANDMDDIIQETLLVILAQIRGFERRGIGSFRGWMKTISWRCWCDVLAKAERAKNHLLSKSLRESPAAYESLEADFEKLAIHELLQSSMSIVKRRVEPKTWEAFYLTAMEQVPAGQAAAKLDMQVDAVYAARCRVQRWITQEFKRLDRPSF